MAKTSIIIPSCNEVATTNEGINVLQRTVQDVYENATGDFEVIVGFNGPEYQDFPDYPNFRVLRMPENIGIKAMINILAIIAKGTYLYKSDAHCSFGKGFNEILEADMQDDWIVTPRFYVLDAKTWKWQDERFYDYFYLCCPFTDPRGFRFKAGGHWPERTAQRDDTKQATLDGYIPRWQIDETPQFHGSGWFVNRDFFLNKLGGFPLIDPMGHAQEPPNLGLKTWFLGGKVMVNKKTWYAHMHQDGPAKGYRYTRDQERVSYDIWANYWMKDPKIELFIEKFMPMPSWPENWRDLLKEWRDNGI